MRYAGKDGSDSDGSIGYDSGNCVCVCGLLTDCVIDRDEWMGGGRIQTDKRTKEEIGNRGKKSLNKDEGKMERLGDRVIG